MPELNPIPTPAYNSQSTHNKDTFVPRAHQYNDPMGNHGAPVPSTMGVQKNQAYYLRKSLMEVTRKMYFTKMANLTNMPKHHGDQIRVTVDIPLLHDLNLNDQGIDARGVQIRNGNLYGSSRDVGKILKSLPALTEVGGRVNRVGLSRMERSGTFHEYGMFLEWTERLQDMDSDEAIVETMTRKIVEAAAQVYEDVLQIDLINSAGTVIYAGNNFSRDTMNHESVMTYRTLQRMLEALTAANSPKTTKIISGSTMVDTRTLTACRIAYVPSEVRTLLEKMVDSHGERAFIPIHQYAAAVNGGMENEMGAVGQVRFIEIENMVRWEGAGATEEPDKNMRATNGKYDVYPVLFIGEDCFTTIGFQSSGKKGGNSKVKVITKLPSRDTANSATDPYGKIGFASVQWYYGFLAYRPERIGVIQTTVPY